MPEKDEMGGNPDASQDESLIMSVIQRELGPVLEAMGSRLSEQGEALEEVKDLVFKFTQGLIGAADNHKRTAFGEELSGKYGKDIEPFEGFHKEVYGKGFSDSLMDDFMGEGGPGDDEHDAWIQSKLNDAKGKYGKYVGIKADIPASGEAEKGEEEAMKGEEEERLGEKEEKEGHEAEGEKEEEKGEKEEEAGEGEEEDAISGLMKQMESLTGARHSMSKKPNKSKAPIRR
jgi:hypothetical protein